MLPKVIKVITISDFLEGKSFEKSIGSGSPISIEQVSNISLLIAGEIYVIQAFSIKLPDLSQIREGRGLRKITRRPGSILAGVLDRKLISMSYKQCHILFSEMFF